MGTRPLARLLDLGLTSVGQERETLRQSNLEEVVLGKTGVCKMALPPLDWSRQRQRCPPFRQRLHHPFTPGWARQEALGLNQWLAAGYSATIFATPSRIFSAFPSDPPTTAFPTPRKTSFLVLASTKSMTIVPS